MPRVRLINATAELLNAALDSPETLGAELQTAVPEGWPEFPEALPHTLGVIEEDPASSAWWMYFFLDAETGVLVGSGGFAGAPVNGVVEIGYEIAPVFRRRGYATAAVRELVALAQATGEVRRVVGRTLARDERSAGVLRAIGFRQSESVQDDGHDVTVWTRPLHGTPAQEELISDTSVTEIELTASGFAFRALASGSETGEPVLLLHGMPETGDMWSELMGALATQGYRCVAPDQRGYSPGARPEAVASYGLNHLVDDVFDLATSAGFDRFHLVAHDWGAAVAWAAAADRRSDRIASLTALSIPPYWAFAEATVKDPAAQGYREQLALLTSPDDTFVRLLLAEGARGLRAHLNSHSEDLVKKYLAVLGDPVGFNAAVNWYRAADGHRKVLEDPRPVEGVSLPSMLIWGSRDVAVTRMAVDLGRQYIAGPHEFIELDAGHWLVQEEPEFIAACVRRHLTRHALAGS
ncbi:alpha/beta fold hydrolase [Rhodococcus pyridinivorans]|uniref:alpha/beta fold hydrolase n=1 Tax=Rhodococcus pyridinivorans TaxID=103816 RepID=UPI0020786BF8|nr:alpha/beta fold hydrolase [Rhodococcus pyridinivorans]USI88393.1 alpha/beta fold hydrolase [Rhodococcus pyridinivorans]